VLDRTGEVTSVLYPADEDANVTASDTVVPLTPIKRVIVNPAASDSFTFVLPPLDGKKAYLEFKVRADIKSAGLAGNSNMLQIKVNNKPLGMNNVVKPGKVLVMKGKPERKVNIANRNGYIVYFSNCFMEIDESNTYCPMTFDKHNPFDFKLDITAQAEADALNMVDIQNINEKMSLVFEDIRVVIE
jgi:hypothetical protein